ncbi:MAG: type VI secretion system baseplate subunit TssE [Planctomycetota bacterium]
MADLAPSERLQPSLLDRLEDDEPDKRVEPVERRVLSLERLKESVIRDLSWLLNCENLTPVHDFQDYPDAATSTVNFGVPPHSGLVLNRGQRSELEEKLRESIVRFEPRLIGSTVRVAAVVNETDTSSNALRFEIEATMWAQPLPLQLMVNAEIDPQTGNLSVQEPAQ